MLKRLFLAASLLTLAAAPVPAKLTVGIYPSYPPLDMKDPATGTLRGFDVALAGDLAKRMGTQFTFQETSFAQLLPSVQTRRIALFFNGMNDTPARQASIGFVDYLRSGTQFMVRAADSETYKNVSALCGKKVAGSRSTNLPSQIAAWSQANCQAHNLAAVVFLDADNNIDARSQMRQGRVDAMVQDSLTIPFVQSQEKGVYAAVGEPFDITVMGIGVGKTDTALQNALQTALNAMIEDGSYAGLLKTWGLPPSSGIPHATIDMGS